LANTPQVNGVIGGDGDQGALVDQELGKEHGALGFALVFGMGIDARSSQTKKYIKNIILIRSSEIKFQKYPHLHANVARFVANR